MTDIPHSFVSDALTHPMQQQCEEVTRLQNELRAAEERALRPDMTFDEYLENRLERERIVSALITVKDKLAAAAKAVVDFQEDVSPSPPTAAN